MNNATIHRYRSLLMDGVTDEMRARCKVSIIAAIEREILLMPDAVAAHEQLGDDIDEAIDPPTKRRRCGDPVQQAPVVEESLLDQSALGQYERYRKAYSKVRVNLLPWWEEHEPEFPAVAAVARRIHATPASEASSERLFSLGGRIKTIDRSRVTPTHLKEVLVVAGHKQDKKRRAENKKRSNASQHNVAH